MKFLGKILFVACFIFGAAGMAQADAEFGTPAEAKAMAELAAKTIEAKGIDAAIVEFQTKGGNFHDRDLYVIAFDAEGVNIAHGIKAALRGRNLMNLRDVEGTPMVQEFLKITDAGWVEYKWQHPKYEKIMTKTSYIVKVGDYWVGVGAFKE